jgi:predicted RNA methylase
MCSDERRLEAYRTAIKCLSRDLIVADVGAGTGVLSFMAAEEGARMVYAIEAAKISNVCKKQTKERNLGAIIKVMQCRAEIAPLGKESVDLIVSEWMGYFLLFERMLPSVLAFRDRCLKKDGSIIPRAASILLGATDAPKKPN